LSETPQQPSHFLAKRIDGCIFLTNGLLNIELENICDFSNLFPLITAEGKRLKFRKPIETPPDEPILSPIFFEVS